MSPEFRAFRYYKKNLDKYPLDGILFSQDAFDKLMAMYKSIADKFGADEKEFMKIIHKSYDRYINRALR